MITIVLDQYGFGSHRSGIVVGIADEDGGVTVTFEGETSNDEAIDRTLQPNEARELAAVLLHYAHECELTFRRIA